MLEVTDDSGFLAVVVPAAYSTFVDNKWKFDQLFGHFRHQMAMRSLLIWGTGLEGCWKVDVRARKSSIRGFREASGPLQVVGGAVLLTNYESLTMAAQFEEVRLPEKHQEDNLVPLADGGYSCRIVQMFDPEGQESADNGGADFVLEFTRPKVLPAAWSTVPWFSADGENV
jgi:hypothetical protein